MSGELARHEACKAARQTSRVLIYRERVSHGAHTGVGKESQGEGRGLTCQTVSITVECLVFPAPAHP